MNQYKRYEGETDEELIYRVCSEKDLIGTWEDVADILNELLGTDYKESAFRKKYQSFQKMLKGNQNRFASTDSQVASIREETLKLEKERKKLQTEKIEYNKWLRENARDELITEKIIDAIANLEPLSPPKYIPPASNRKSYLLAMGDFHYGIEFGIKDFYGNVINQYSPEIFESRMNLLFSKVVEIIDKETIDELDVWALGDEIQGMLRLNSQLMQLRYGVIESAIKFADYMASWLNELSQFTRIKYQMVMDSNHNQLRLCGAPKNAFVDENMSRVILTILQEKLKNNDNVIIVENPTGMNYGLFSTYTVLGIHGEVKNLSDAISEYSKAYGTPIDYCIGAHMHHSQSSEVGINSEAISIRSIIGVDPYGMSLRKTSNPGASLFCFSQTNGLECEYKIKL